MQIARPPLRLAIHHHGTLGILSRKIRTEHFHFRDHLGVLVDWRKGTLAGVGDALAVLRDVCSLAIYIYVSELPRERERRLGHLYDLARITWRVQRVVVAQGRPGQDLEVLSCVASDQREMLQIAGGNERGLLSGVSSGQLRDSGLHHNGLRAGTDLKFDLHGTAIGTIQANSRAMPFLKALHLHKYVVRTRR